MRMDSSPCLMQFPKSCQAQVLRLVLHGVNGKPDGLGRSAAFHHDGDELVGDGPVKPGLDNTVHPHPIEKWGKEAEGRTWPWREYLPKVSKKRSRHWW